MNVLRWLVIALAGGFAFALPAFAKDCAPYHEPQSASLSVFAAGKADPGALASWPDVSIAPSAAPADIVWDPQSGNAYDRQGRVISEKISDVCALSAVVSQSRATAILGELAAKGGVDLFTAPAANGYAYEGEKVGVIVSLRKNTDHRYVTVFDLTGDGSISLLYPIASDGNGLVKPGHLVKVPDLDVSKPYGSDHFVAVVSDAPQTDFREELAYVIGRVRVSQGVYYTDVVASRRNAAKLVETVVGAVRRLAAEDPSVAIATTTLFTAARPRMTLRPVRAENILFPRAAPMSLMTDIAYRPSALSYSRPEGAPEAALRLVLAQAPPASNGPSPAKLALVIGNADYKNANVLANPKNDAGDIASLLMKDGFQLVGGAAQTDLSIAQMQDVLRATYAEAKSAGSLFVFYAGHGVQAGGHNYLIPVDAKLDSEADLDVEAVKLDDVFHAAGPAGHSLIVLDACRTSDFPLKDSHGARRGLYALGLLPEILPGGLVAYSTLPGHVASDGTGAHSPYAAALLLHMQEPNKSAREILGEVYDDFSKSLGNQHIADENTQLPIFEDMMGSQQFYF